jgi:polyhydroxybutyrate depolymerase
MFMKKEFVSFLVLALFLSMFSFASASEPTYEIKNGSMQFGGHTRTYKYYVPSSYTGKNALPLMISFHGSGSSADGQILLTHYHKIAEKEGFIVVFPDSTVINQDDEVIVPTDHSFDPNSPLIRRWNLGNTSGTLATIDDVGFASALIDTFAENFNVDASRVYASGMSNGAMFSNRLGVELSDRIAGIGAVTGQLGLNMAQKGPVAPVTTVLVMGDTDPVVPYEGREGSLLSVDETIQYWVNANKTVTKPRVSYLPQVAENDPTNIRREVYGGGKYGTEVILYAVEGGGHTWPGGPQYLPPSSIGLTSMHMDASQAIWDELKTHKIAKLKNENNKK